MKADLHATSRELAELLKNRHLAWVNGRLAEIHSDYLDHILPSGRRGTVFARFVNVSLHATATPIEQAAIDRLTWEK